MPTASMSCFQATSTQICHKQNQLNITGSPPAHNRTQLPTSHTGPQIISYKGHNEVMQGRWQAKLKYIRPYKRIVKIGFRNGEIVGAQLVNTHSGGLQRGRNAIAAISATARPINADDEVPEESVPAETKSLAEAGVDWLDAFHRFSRPHTVIGSAVGVISVSLLAIQNPAELSSTFLQGLLQALVPALFMNIYIVGLNQVYDVNIDKVNKPYLPLASGEFSMTTGVTIITVCALMSLGIGVMVGSRPLLWALLVSLVLGTAYSVDVPLLRWKRSALAAATCILVVRAVVVQLGFYFHMQNFVFGRAAVMTRPLWFATAFMSFFSVVIALAKDIPDVEGDKLYGIRSFSVRLGQKTVFWMCVWLIQAAYTVAMSVGITSPTTWGKVAMVVGHSGLAALLWARAKATNLKSRAAIVSFYMFIWQLFYAEYLIIPFVR